MSVLPVGFGSSSSGGGGSVDVGDIGHSVRLRRSASAYFSKTLAAPTNNKKWTWSGWVKRSEIGVAHGLFDRYVGSVDFSSLYISNDNRIYFYTVVTGPTDYSVETAANSFRDTTGWVNITFVFDSDNAVQADRAIIYVSGVRQTVTNTYGAIPSGHTTYLNTAAAHSLGRLVDNSRYTDGYLARVCFVDGQALDPTSFGYFNTQINEWVSKTQAQVKAVVDAGGTNSFMLDFDNGTSLTTLGYDKSSKANNWTLNNFSLTAGSTYDWMLDVPGNSYATLNPLVPSTNHTLSNGNLTATLSSAVDPRFVKASMFVSAGKWSAEYERISGSSVGSCGVGDAGAITSGGGVPQANSVVYFGNGVIYKNAVSQGTFATYTTGNKIRIELDRDNLTCAFYKDNVLVTTITGLTAADYTFGGFANQAGDVFAYNFGQQPLQAGTPNTGFRALCQANLPTPAILNPELHMDIKLHVGNGTSQNITGVAFAPDLVWYKSRSNAINNVLTDSIRGASKQLYSDATAAEGTDGNSITSLNSGGFSVGPSSTINTNGATYVDWLWKAGGAAVTNNDGSISSQVSANVTAGFSVATFASLSSGNSTVGHGLPKRPDLVVAKARNGSSFNWAVWHKNLANDIYRFLRLNTTDPEQNPGSVIWGAGITDTVVGITNGQAVEASKDCVLYCYTGIEGYSKFTVVTMNGSADGQYIDLGFKAAIVDMKRIDAASNWLRWDKARSPDNPVNELLYPNLSNAEATADLVIDICSQGVKVRGVVSGTWIVCAWADVPAKYSLAR